MPAQPATSRKLKKLNTDSYLEIVMLKCPLCGAHIIEPLWWMEYNPVRVCATCDNEFEAKSAITDRRAIKFIVEKEKLKDVKLA